MKQSGTLPIGVLIDGTRHTAFELRPATVGDNVEAMEALGNVSAIRISAAVYARQLVSLGTLAKEQITTELILSLSPVDYGALEEAQEALKKKLLEFGQPSPGGTTPAPSVSATASA